MEPISGFVVIAGVAGLTKALSSNTERILNALDGQPSKAVQHERVVIVEVPVPDIMAEDSMKLGS